MKLKINQEYYKLVPRPTPEEYEALKESIKTDGQEIPIIVNSANEILDGYSRNQICVELGIDPKFVVKTFANKNDEKIFVVEINLKRRHLDKSQKVNMGIILQPLYAERAKQRQAATQIKAGTNKTPIGLPKNLGNPHMGETDEQVADVIGVSRETFRQGKEVKEKAPDLWAKVERQEISIGSAHENVKLTENLTKEKQEAIAPKLGVIKYQSGREGLSQDEKKKVVEKLATQSQRSKVEDVDIERAVKTVKVESLTKDKSPEVQKKAVELVEQKSRSGERIQTIDVVREAEEESVRTLSVNKQLDTFFDRLSQIKLPPSKHKEDVEQLNLEYIRHIAALVRQNHLHCPKCKNTKLKWSCGHDIEG